MALESVIIRAGERLSRSICLLSSPSGLALLVASLVGAPGASGCAPPQEIRPPSRLNVLLITIDTLRADAVGAYGRSGNPTPWIDRVAAGGVRFASAHAHNVVTLPSHANILSGRLPIDHGVRDNSGFRFPANQDTFATLLKAHGYRTGAFVSAFPLESRFGLARGFDVYDDRFADAGPRPAFLVQEREGTETVALARRWIETAGEQPWFCWIHLYEPHFPYSARGSFASRFPGDPYLAEVSAADAALAPILEPLLGPDTDGRTLVAVTSDHGESLGEHGEATHGVFAYEAALKVPIVLYAPNLLASRVVETAAQHVDLLPTVLDIVSLPVPADLDGRSLVPSMTGSAGRPTVTYFEALSGSLNRGWAPLAGIVHNRIKYIDLPIPELYDLSSDPREERNLATSHRALREQMHAQLESVRATAGRKGRSVRDARVTEHPDTRERLRSLGYVTAGAPAPRGIYTIDDDPKRLIALDAILEEVIGLYLDGRVSEALTRCRELVRRRPQMAVALLYLATLEREHGNLTAGIEALRRVVAINPDDGDAASLLGVYLTEAGRPREAVMVLEPLVRRPDANPDAITAHALALASIGRVEDARSALAAAQRREPSNARLFVQTGTISLMAGDRRAARHAFESAIGLNPNLARAHSSLGVIAAEEGRISDAAAAWRRAVVLDPREYEKLLTLGTFHWKAGRRDMARPYFEFFVASAPHARYSREIATVREWLER